MLAQKVLFLMCSASTLGQHVMPGPALLTAITPKMHLLQKLRHLWPANHGRAIPAALLQPRGALSGHMELYNINWDLCGPLSERFTEFMQVHNSQAFCWFIYSSQMQNEACFYECDPILGHFQPPAWNRLSS